MKHVTIERKFDQTLHDTLRTTIQIKYHLILPTVPKLIHFSVVMTTTNQIHFKACIKINSLCEKEIYVLPIIIKKLPLKNWSIFLCFSYQSSLYK